ncbi:proton channel OtopLc-like [Polistes fuscatus]|uniref:proton channel OtopLc-like n=1 Tax=Polistes fuscatus TaxID=30207 RepID=UPI001CA93E64|nr:proton channel OtopLc-like [Polistes fuscatus]
MANIINSESKESTVSVPTPVTITTEMENNKNLSSHGRTNNSRRESNGFNAVIHHKRGLFGALISGIGSNMSLPSCMPHDQDFLQGHPPNLGLPVPLRTNQKNLDQYRPDDDLRKLHRTNYLQLTPVNTACVSLTALDNDKAKAPILKVTQSTSQDPKNENLSDDLVSTVSMLYAKLLIVIGLALPITASITHKVPIILNQGFYLYLYLGSVTFVITMYASMLKDKAVKKLILQGKRQEETFSFDEKGARVHTNQTQQYGSFCLRFGAVGFGAGSLVFTGLQIGAEIASGPFRAITPAARLLLITAQMHFIFLNSKNLELARLGALGKLGLMHMIATNLCEWLQALIEETHNEIDQLGHAYEGEVEMLKSLLRDASPFLFPCTIEFSLICAVILFEMWKRTDERIETKGIRSTRSMHRLSIDCTSAHRGLFGGILLVAATILSLIMFFVLRETKHKMAIQQVTALEAAILSLGAIASISGALKIQHLNEKKCSKTPRLDSTLLTAAQSGIYLHCLFGIVGSLLTMGPMWVLSLITDFLTLIQSTCQTLLVKIAWKRRCTTGKEKPGKELITFLIVVNIALWTVNTLEKSRAGVRPDHLRLFGVWAWTIITHVSMPLAIFYRFHSAICLFEVWKSCYKYRPCNENSRAIC